MSTTLHRHMQIRGAVDTVAIRSATFNGCEHIVVPVVALVGDIVVTALGSSGPEFVPSAVLSKIPAAWNGRPVLTNHPSFDGEGGGSANVPTILETMRIGDVFNTTWDGKRLLMEAWINVERAAALGGDAISVVERCQAGEAVEVSVGCYIDLEEKAGTSPSGVPYEFEWISLVQDHLALLPKGLQGACSIAAGCGALRLLSEELKEVNMSEKPSLLARILAMVNSEKDESADVAKEELETVVSAPVVLRAAECSCTDAGNKEKVMNKVKELATRLIASTRFAEEDRETLEKFPEARLEALNACLDAEVVTMKVDAAEAIAAIAAATPTVKTEAEWLSEAPADVRSLVIAARAQEAAVRTSLITSLSTAQKVYTVAQLTAKTTDDLRQLAEVLKIQSATVDFAGLATTPPDTPAALPPRGYSLALAKQRGTDVVQKAN